MNKTNATKVASCMPILRDYNEECHPRRPLRAQAASPGICSSCPPGSTPVLWGQTRTYSDHHCPARFASFASEKCLVWKFWLFSQKEISSYTVFWLALFVQHTHMSSSFLSFSRPVGIAIVHSSILPFVILWDACSFCCNKQCYRRTLCIWRNGNGSKGTLLLGDRIYSACDLM